MQIEKDRRKWIRQELDPPQVGILATEDQGYEAGTNLANPPLCLYVDLLNKSSDGANIKLEKGLEQGSTLYLQTFSDRRNVWESFRGEARWISEISAISTYFLVGIEFLKLKADDEQRLPGLESGQIPLPGDYETLMHTRFFQSVPRSAICLIRQGIIHRDIKAANMLIRRGDQIKILDFGLSCPVGSENLNFPGSVPYMSPEEIEGAAVDQRTDIYALGITAYEMVAGQRPFPEDDLMALMDMHLKRDIPDPVQLRSDLPDGLRQFIFKACARDPAHRYADIKQAMADLKPGANKFGPLDRPFPPEKRCMTTLHLFYSEQQQLSLKQLMEEFSAKVQEIGVDLKAVDFREV